jgi:hypothetical protein
MQKKNLETLEKMSPEHIIFDTLLALLVMIRYVWCTYGNYGIERRK